VPAFGLRALPLAGRALFALVFGIAVAPAFVPIAETERYWVFVLVEEFLKGLPVALGTSAVLWAATMAGNLTDALRGSTETSALAVIDSGATPIGTLLSLLASLLFLKLGGAAHLVSALASPDLAADEPLLGACFAVLRSIELGVVIATPLVIVATVLEAAILLMTRGVPAMEIGSTFAPLRSLAILTALALLLPPISESLTDHLHSAWSRSAHHPP
jgi:flagellar biosynthesis protein FliR